MSDEGKLNFFLGVKVDYNDKGMLLTQSAYAKEILQRAGMQDCKPISTPVDVKSKLSQEGGDKVDDPTLYRSLDGALQYLTLNSLISSMLYTSSVCSCMIQGLLT